MTIKRFNLNHVRGYHQLFEFEPGVNVLVGDSDSGKSNVVRALAAVISNKVSAGEFLTTGEDDGEATIGFNREPSSTHAKFVALGKTRNGSTAYERGDKSATTKFDKVGLTVPVQIAQVLRMGERNLGGEDINLTVAGQRDRVPVIDHTPAQSARIIGSVSGFDAVYRAASEAAKLARDAERNYAAAKDEATAALARFRAARDAVDIKAVKAAYDAAVHAVAAADAASDAVDEISALAATVEENNECHAAASRFVQRIESKVVAAREAVGRYEQAQERVEELSGAIGFAMACVEDHQRATVRVKEAKAAHQDAAVSLGFGRCPTCGQELKQ